MRAYDVQPEVAVAEAKPRFAAECLDARKRVPRFVGPPPAPFLVRDSGERIENAVEIG